MAKAFEDASGTLGGRVRVPKAAEIVAGRIRKSVLSAELEAGSRLPSELLLQQQFNVSRPIVREAIRILESEGLIHVARGPGGGARVNPASIHMLTRATGYALQSRGATLANVYAVRCIIEPPAAADAARTRPAEAAAALTAQVAVEWSTRQDPVLGAKAITDFHRILLEECGNVALGVVGAALQDVVERHLALALRANQQGSAPRAEGRSLRRLETGIRSHERLIQFIAAGDANGAEAHWAAHMEATSEYWVKSVGRTSVIDTLD